MPAPLDLTGRRFGGLLVLGRGPDLQRQHARRTWMVECACGRMECYPQARLTSTRPDAVRACAACEAPTCLICSRKLPERSAQRVCEGLCRTLRTREIKRDSARRHMADPDVQQSERDRKAARRHARVSDPARAAHKRERSRQYEQLRRARRQALSPEEAARLVERLRAASRACAARRRAILRADPAAHRRRLDVLADWRRRRRLLTMLITPLPGA